MLKTVLILIVLIGMFITGLDTIHHTVSQSVQTSTQRHLDEIDRNS